VNLTGITSTEARSPALERKVRQGQEIALLQAGRAVKQKQIDDANLVVAGLQKNQNLITMRRDYYKAGDAAIRYAERATTAQFSPQIDFR
jgi:precorrin-2 methylase